MPTTVPQPTFGPTGFIIPDPNDIFTGCLNDIDIAFGGNLNLGVATPQGQLASSLAAIINNVNETFQFYTQQVDPAFADGRMQDAIARIYFIQRKAPTPTVVEAICSGGLGVVIPVGSLAQAADGNVYTCTQAGTIGASGSVTLTFECTVVGSIGCPAGNLNTIYQSIPGWDSILNPQDGVIGSDVESRTDFEIRRFDSVAKNAMGFLPAVLGAVWDVDGVTDAYVTENFTGSPASIGGVTIAAHSIYVAVVGGLAADVAEAIWSKKAPGCAMTGTTTVTVFDDQSGYDPPFPSYQISFQIPTPLEILFNVNLVNSDQVPATAQTLIANAIINAFAGGDGGARARIGSTVLASRFYGPVTALGSWAQIISITVGSENAPSVQITGSIGGTGPLSVLSVSAILGGTGVITIGQFLSGSAGGSGGPAVGTQIVAQLSGSAGGTGTYSVSINQNLPSGTINLSVPTSNSVPCRIDQVPVTSSLVIVVNTT